MTYNESAALLENVKISRKNWIEFRDAEIELAWRYRGNGTLFRFSAEQCDAAKILLSAACDTQLKHLYEAYVIACKAANIDPEEKGTNRPEMAYIGQDNIPF